MLPLYNLNMNSPLVINIQILQLFSCLKCTRQQILSTLRRQRSLATVLPIGTERVSAWDCLSIIMGCREREREREKEWERLLITAYNATSFSVYRPRWVKLSAHSQDQNHLFFRREKKKISQWFMQLCNKQTTIKWFVVGWILSGIFPLVFTQYAPITRGLV